MTSEVSSAETPTDAGADRHDWVEFVRFRLGDADYCLELGRLERILRDPSVTPVPGTAATIAGVTNLGSRIPVVVDGRALLGLADRPDDAESVFLLFDRGDARPSGLLVDGVAGIEAHHVEDLRPPGELDWDPPVGRQWFRAVAVGPGGERAEADDPDQNGSHDRLTDDRLTGVFDLDAVFAEARGQA